MESNFELMSEMKEILKEIKKEIVLTNRIFKKVKL
jgi:hypothetical protein